MLHDDLNFISSFGQANKINLVLAAKFKVSSNSVFPINNILKIENKDF